MEIGEDRGDGAIVETHWATLDSRGNYWVGLMDGARVFTPTGAFLRKVGRSGQGPLEFSSAGPMYTDARGRVHLLDPRNARETIVTGDFELDTSYAVPGGRVYEALELPGNDRQVLNAVIQTADRFGKPLHIVEQSRIVASFGLVEQGAYTGLMMHLLRRLTLGPDGTIYSGSYFEYATEAWTPSGERLMGLRRPGLWEPPPGGEPRPISPENPPPGLLLALRADSLNRLWVVAWLPRKDWRQHVTEVRLPNGLVLLRPENGNASLYTTIIEVIDMRAGEVLASSEFDERVEGFLTTNVVYGNRLLESSLPRLVAWNLRLTGRLARNGG